MLKRFFKKITENGHYLFVGLFFLLSSNKAHAVAANNFLSSACSDPTGQLIIQFLGGIGVAMNLANLVQEFVSGSNSGYFAKVLGIVVGVVFIINPTTLGSILKALGM
jgi:hypothetical protein